MSTPSPSPSPVKVLVPGNHLMVGLLGERDERLRVIEAAFPGTTMFVRGNEISIEGPESDAVANLFRELVVLLQRGHTVDAADIVRTIEMVKANERPSEVLTADIMRSARGRTVRPKTSGQKRYTDAIANNVVTFGIGPAGTGKSFLAVALAVQALQAKQVERIILTRPAVEAGERLGFLPGDLMAKVDPYLRPLYDALFDLLGTDAVPRLMERGAIEIAPLAFMRGRAQPLDTPVLTPDGFMPIGCLQVDDLVVGSDGRPTPVVGVFPQGPKDVFRVSTSDGGSTLASGDHLWAVKTPGDERWQVSTTDKLGGQLWQLPVVGMVEFAPQPVPRDPYVLGRQLGAPSPDVVGRLAALSAVSRPTSSGTAVLDRDMRDSAQGIPRSYLFSSSSARLALLRGLLSGGVSHADRSIRYQAPSPAIRDDVVFLVRSLGGVAVADHQLINIRLPALGTSPPTRFIDAVQHAGTAECVCIAVGAPDSLYVTTDFIVTHNTLNASFIILDEAQNTSPEQMKMFLTRIGFGSKAVVTGDVTQIDIPGGKSGLVGLDTILGGIDGIAFVQLTQKDVVRHRIVQDIVSAYERARR